MIQVETIQSGQPLAPGFTRWGACTPCLLPVWGMDEDPMMLPAGWTVAIGQDALDENQALAGAMMALIALGALVLIHDEAALN